MPTNISTIQCDKLTKFIGQHSKQPEYTGTVAAHAIQQLFNINTR